VENAVIIANNLDIPLLYISTAGIFDGRKDVYDDWDMPNPLGVYARSKYMGERYVVENARRYLICRAGWIMGGGHKDKKFVKKIMTQINSGVTELNVVNDKDGTPTYTHDFAKNTLMLLESGIWGLYNMVCHGMTSRYEVAAEVIRILKLENQVKLNSVGSDYFSTDYYAPRPKSERLINRKLMLRGIDYMQDWKSALSEYLNDYSF
jgi:dTDP-4-dehydrorhamnose reductase